MNIRWRVLVGLILSILFAAMATGIAQKTDLSQDAIKKPPKEDCEGYYKTATTSKYTFPIDLNNDQQYQHLMSNLAVSQAFAELYLACKEHSR